LSKVDLSVEFCGIKFKNPFILGSGPTTGDAERLKKAAKMGWAGAVTKTIGPWGWPEDREGYRHPRPNYWLWRFTPYIEKTSPFAFENITGIDKLGKTRWLKKEVKAAKEANIPLIVSVTAPTPEGYAELARSVEEAGADMVEMNISGPFAITEMGMGDLAGKEIRMASESVKAVKKACSVPIMPKLTANVTPTTLVEIAKAIEQAGADAIASINTVLGVMGIDIETGIPITACVNTEEKLGTIYGGLSGPVIKPIGLRVLAQIASNVKIPASSGGGIFDWTDSVEYLMMGATLLPLVTGPMVFGYGMIRGLMKGLEEFMERKGYNGIGDFRGISLKYLGKYKNLKTEPPVKAAVDAVACTGCGKCVDACEAGGGNAMKMVERVAKVDESTCGGCNLCILVCPEKAVSLVGLPKE